MSFMKRVLRKLLVPAAGLVTAFILAVGAAWAAGAVTVVQKDRSFSTAAVQIARGDSIHFSNDDDFVHQIYVNGNGIKFESDEQDPGQVVDLKFPIAGDFTVLCHIHPKMKLAVTVR